MMNDNYISVASDVKTEAINGGGGGGISESGDSSPLRQAAQQNAALAAAHMPVANSNNGGGVGRSDICRDYLNNVCFRGARCRYYHPPEMTSSTERSKEVIKDFCHDYQNKGCTRETCRYVHCSREDMDEYNRSGKINESLAKALVAVTGQEVVDGRPLCKEYLSGHCSRGSRCRFWHINPREERERRQLERMNGGGAAVYGRGGGSGVAGGGSGSSGGGGGAVGVGGGAGGGVGGGGTSNSATVRGAADRISSNVGYGGANPGGYEANPYEAQFDYRRQPDYKRPRLDDERSAYPGVVPGSGRVPSPAGFAAMQEETLALRRKIEVLKQTVAELSAANDNLIAENARLRAKLQVPSVGAPPSVNDPGLVGSMAASALGGVLTNSQALAGPTVSQSAGLAAGMAADHLAVSLAAAAQQSMAAAQQSMAMSATSDVVHWSAMRR